MRRFLSSLKSPIDSFWAVALLLLTSFIVRLPLLLTAGSEDIKTWESFASLISTNGILWLYDHAEAFNHPPLGALYAFIAQWLANLTSLEFGTVFRFGTLALDGLSCWLLWQMKPLWGLLYCFSPVSILVSAHHGNTDALYVFLLLLACLWAQNNRDRAYVALTFAAQIKIIAVLMLPAFWIAKPPRTSFATICKLSIAASPTIAVLALSGWAFIRQVLLYQPVGYPFGIGELLFCFSNSTNEALVSLWSYHKVLKYLLVAGLLITSYLISRLKNQMQTLFAFALIFTLVIPAVGLQYFILLSAFGFGNGVLWWISYQILAGGFLLTSYWPASWAMLSEYRLNELFGLALWAMMLTTLWIFFMRIASQRSSSSA